jgi:hypothetical protein
MSKLRDAAAMNSIDARAVSKDSLAGLMAPIAEVAAENLMGLSEPDFEFVPPQLRRGMSAVHRQLSGEMSALFELLTVYDDLLACRILAQEYPWQKSELTHYEHLRLAWCQFARIGSNFDRYMYEAGQHLSEAIELFSADFELPDLGEGPDRAGPKRDASCRESPVDRWYTVAPKSAGAAIVPEMRVASTWPGTLAPFTEHYAAARSELLREIDARTAAVGSAITGFLVAHGTALLDLVGRYNDMIKNFRRLYRS